MTHFNQESDLNTQVTWSAKYDALFKTLNIAIDKIVDPRYAKQGTSGTCYVLLCIKGSKSTNTIGELPDIGGMNLNDNFNKIPFIPI